MKRLQVAALLLASVLGGCGQATGADESTCRIPGEGAPVPERTLGVNDTAAQMMGSQSQALGNYERCMKSAAWDFRHLPDGIEPVSRAVVSRCQEYADQWRFAELLLDNHKISTSPDSMDHLSQRSSHALGYVAEVRACLKSGKPPVAR